MNSFYSQVDLNMLGFKSVGTNVLVSKNVQFYDIAKISIGNHVRIDDFCILSGSITIGSHVHISAYCALYGKFGIELEDYTGLSPRCTVFSASDDFSGDFLISPMVNVEYTNLNKGKVLISRYSQIGANCIIFPNLTVSEGVAVGAFSLVNASLDEWSIYAGIPAKRLKSRTKGLLKFVNEKNMK
ncbi:MAG: acyltransferase [Paludibacter sp.]|nr:acyltransferase [Paludibacter sp.]